MKWKSYLANKHSEQIFLQLNLLFRASTLQNTSSASNVNSKCGKKKANKSSISSLFISNLNHAAKQQESDPIASWEIWHIFERESLPPNNLLFSDHVSDQPWILHQKLSRHFQLSMELPQMQTEAWWDKAHLYGPLSMNNKLPAARIEHFNKVCHIHSANTQFFEIGKV